MALAFRGMLRRSSRKQLLFKVVKRTLILFFLGLLISNQAKHGKSSQGYIPCAKCTQLGVNDNTVHLG